MNQNNRPILHGYETLRHAGSRFITYGCLSSFIKLAVSLCKI